MFTPRPSPRQLPRPPRVRNQGGASVPFEHDAAHRRASGHRPGACAHARPRRPSTERLALLRAVFRRRGRASHRARPGRPGRIPRHRPRSGLRVGLQIARASHQLGAQRIRQQHRLAGLFRLHVRAGIFQDWPWQAHRSAVDPPHGPQHPRPGLRRRALRPAATHR